LLVGRPQVAAARYEALVPAAHSGEIKEPALRLSVYMGLGNAHRKLGQRKEATAAYNAALALTAEADNVDRLAATFWKLSVAWQQAGELERARQYASRSLALSEAATDICQVITIHVSLAELEQQAGHWDAAQTHLEAALAVAEQLRDDHQCAEALHGLARLVFKRDKMSDDLLKQAEDYANRCLDYAGKVADDALLGKAWAVVGLVQDSQGDPTASDKSYQQAIARLKQAQADAALSETYFEYAQLLRKRGEVRRAGEYLEQAYLLGRG
jgi:tetratricopeptide (TPR) repeat protein